MAVDLKKHILNEHGGKRPFKCHICDIRYVHEFALGEHIKAIHNKEKDLRCYICDMKFDAVSFMSKHISNIYVLPQKKTSKSSTNKEIKCELCDKLFFYKQDLKDHADSQHNNTNFS